MKFLYSSRASVSLSDEEENGSLRNIFKISSMLGRFSGRELQHLAIIRQKEGGKSLFSSVERSLCLERFFFSFSTPLTSLLFNFFFFRPFFFVLIFTTLTTITTIPIPISTYTATRSTCPSPLSRATALFTRSHFR